MTTTATDAGQATASTADADFAAFVAEQAAAAAPAEEAAPAKEAPAEAASETAEVAEGDAVEAKADDAKPEPEVEEKPEPTISRQLEAINKARRKTEAALAKQRAELEARAATLAKEAEQYKDLAPKVAAYERAKARAKVDPVAALLELGIGEENFEAVARAVFAASRSAPEHVRSESATAKRIREQEEAAQAAIRRVEELEKRISEERETAQRERVVAQFFGGIERAAEAAPLVAKLIKADPADAREQIEKIATALHERGEAITPQRCVAEFEARLKARLAALGYDDPASSQGAKPNQQGRTKAARSLGNDLSTSTRPRPATSTPEDDFAAFLEDVKAGRIDG